jgi:hypothetical protein
VKVQEPSGETKQVTLPVLNVDIHYIEGVQNGSANAPSRAGLGCSDWDYKGGSIWKDKIQQWLLFRGILWVKVPVGAKHSTRIIGKANDLNLVAFYAVGEHTSTV